MAVRGVAITILDLSMRDWALRGIWTHTQNCPCLCMDMKSAALRRRHEAAGLRFEVATTLARDR